MSIVVCGPEGSGTRALTAILGRLCDPRPVRHLSLPMGEWWWTAEDIEGEMPVIITRRPDCQFLSAFRQGCTDSYEQAIHEWHRAISVLASIRGAIWLSYEAMAADATTQLQNVCDDLDVPFDASRLEGVGWPWRDENAKYLR